MADILIRGMDMPKYTTKAEFGIDADGNPLCMVYHKDGTEPDIYDVVPLPEGYGRLGDLDAIIKSLNEVEADFDKKGFNQGACWFHVIAELLKKAPTIVPAEGGGEK